MAEENHLFLSLFLCYTITMMLGSKEFVKTL